MLCAQRVHESARLKETAQSAELDRLRAVVRQRSDELAASRTDAARWEAAHARAEGALLHNGPDSAADAGNNDGLVNELLAQIEYWRAEAQARPDLETVKPAAPTAPTGERDHANNAAEICATPLRVHELGTVSDGSSEHGDRNSAQTRIDDAQQEVAKLRSQLEEATHASTPVRQQVLEDAPHILSRADEKEEVSSSSEPLKDQEREAVKLAHSVDACTSVEQVKASHLTILVSFMA